MQLIELYLKGRNSFSKNGFESPGIETRAILSKSLKIDSWEIYAHPEKRVTAELQTLFEQLIRQRLSGKPLAYVTGEKEFFSRSFLVKPCVLIPRPETEIVAEVAIETARGFKNPRILDLGTGSGCLAVTVSLEAGKCEVFASDISAQALAIAKKNAEINKAKVHFINSFLFGSFAKFSFDMIISNPPYVSEDEYTNLSEEIKLHEPRAALVGGRDGLWFFRKIAAESRGALREGGFLLLETGAGQADKVEKILFENGFRDVRSIADYGGIKRVVKAIWKK